MSNSPSENKNVPYTSITWDGLSDSNKRYSMWASNYTNATLHKSLDFSNVGLYDSAGGIQDEDFRKFHQMTLYIAFESGSAISHGKARKTFMITSNLPEKLSYSIGSDWAQPLNFGNATTNLLMEMATSVGGVAPKSGVSRATTLKVWNGTKPLSLNLTIPVIDDTEDGGKSNNGINTNLVEALEILGSLVLPKRNNSSFYTSPPSPLAFTVKYRQGFTEDGELGKVEPYTISSNQYCRIMLQLGGILLVDKCIIEGIDVTYPNTKTMIKHSYRNELFGRTGNSYLHPLLAEVTLRISTVEALTAENYSKMLWAKTQDNVGHGVVDASEGILGYGSAMAVASYTKLKEMFRSKKETP